MAEENSGVSEHAFSRTELLIGRPALDRLRKAKVVVFGLGGVGSYTVEALARAGIGHLVLVDYDTINLTNLNRQLIATHETLGRLKVEAARDRIMTINPEMIVDVHATMYLPGDPDRLKLFEQTDYIVDAVDNVTAKLDLAEQADRLSIPLISSMGTGNKLDPTRFEVADIFQTSVCPLCRVMRRELRKRGVKHLNVVYSREQPRCQSEQTFPASISFVPPISGLIMAGEVVRHLIGLIEPSQPDTGMNYG